MKKIILFAANGFIGESIIDYTKTNQKDYQIIAVSRKPIPQLPEGYKQVRWDGKTCGPWTKELEGADLVINLAGKSVNCRYTKKNKAEIFASRLDSTRIIGEAIQDCKQKPICWINIASATIYEHSLERPNTEETGLIGKGFSVHVCRAWEKAFFAFRDLPTKQILLRSTIVLGKNGGVYPVLKKLARLGLGGKMGKGNQLISWIHIHDFCRALFFVSESTSSSSIYNIGSPNPVRNELFQKELRKSLHIPYFINQTHWMLKTGALLIGTETELILKSRYVFPQNFIDQGFLFRFPTIQSCLDDLNH
ncbi:TIGR01777 family oxidoreductase [Fluviicola chungangensis]|nr:TIGR01777 family oxidoreductase [Fluviicola chungangensis]